MATDGVLKNPKVFPVSEPQIYIDIKRDKCSRLGLQVADVYKAIENAGAPSKIEQLKKVIVRDKILLPDVAEFGEIEGPTTVYRIDLCPAIRISGTPVVGKSIAEAADRCINIAETELKSSQMKGFSVVNLTLK
jgi:multidrug efflux pump subunit AcrB